jgi:hypothetical protein
MARIRTVPILAPRFDIDAALALLADGVQTEGEIQQREYEKTTRTWRNKPDHELEFSQTKAEIKATNITNDKVYFFLHEGTKVRYAVLSPDWKSKTTPRRLVSGTGRGRVLFVSKKHPMPGIEAREWTDVIIRNRKRPFKKNMESIMRTIAHTYNRQA